MAEINFCEPRRLAGNVRGVNFTITGLDGVGIGLVERFELAFERSVRLLYDLASPQMYYVFGASQGAITLNNVVGPAGAPRLSCECTARDLVLDAGNTLCQAAGGVNTVGSGLNNNQAAARYVLKNAVPNKLGMSGSTEDFIIRSAVSYMFSDVTN